MSDVQGSSLEGKNEQKNEAAGAGARKEAPIFSVPPAERDGPSKAVWITGALAIAVIVAFVVIAARKKPEASPVTLQPPDPYASSLPLTDFVMSEADSLSGGKLIYLDGKVQNTGSKTVAGATAQVVFHNDEGLTPQIQAVPLALIHMKSPYIDTQPLSADPIKPGEDREFRLTFETVPDNWNTQMPDVQVVHTDLR